MIKQEKCNTKEKIISSALTIFADKGFYGASIRDIANHANVNIAAINYHFTNKQTLFFEVIEQGYTSLDQEIKKIPNQQDISFETLCVNILKILLKNSDAVLNSFKIILIRNLPVDCRFDFDNRYIEPPGYEVMLDKLNNELGETVDKNDKIWAIRCIFTQIIHVTIMINSPYVKKQRVMDCVDSKYAEKSIRRLLVAILNDLVSSKSKGKNNEFL